MSTEKHETDVTEIDDGTEPEKLKIETPLVPIHCNGALIGEAVITVRLLLLPPHAQYAEADDSTTELVRVLESMTQSGSVSRDKSQ